MLNAASVPTIANKVEALLNFIEYKICIINNIRYKGKVKKMGYIFLALECTLTLR